MKPSKTYSRIRFTTSGTGPLLLFVPGLGLNTRIFDEVVARLAPKHRCLCLEFSGSVPPKEAQNCSIESLAQEVHQFLQHRNCVPHAVVGHSLGGFVAMHLSLISPSDVPNLILISSAAHGDPSLYTLFLPPNITSAQAVLEHNMSMCVAEPFRQSLAFDRAVQKQRHHSGSGKCFVPLLRASTQFNLVTRLPEIKSRTLIIWGKEDSLATADQTQLLARGISNAKTVYLENVAHLPQIEAPDPTAEAITRFLTSSTVQQQRY